MITTHVLDTSRGAPAAGMAVVLDLRRGTAWVTVGRRETDAQGRVAACSDTAIAAGTYRLTFETGAYHRGHGVTPFFPEVTVTFDVSSGAHYHVPLLLSPFGYSTYRGA
jgi:5-hydroxyisourate hydrolase